MKNILVLGAGMVGRAIAIDLAKTHKITSSDISEENLNKLTERNSEIKTHVADLRDKAKLSDLINSGFDLVVSAVPGFMGYETLRTIIESKKDVVDISFFPENSLDLHDLAVQNNVTAIVDCGVAPGMDNIILGYYDSIMKLTNFECLVGGLPKARKFPFAYKAPFSPADVVEEYTRPARYVENGQTVTKPAMSDTELLEFKEVGTLESFNSDGLRSIIHTMGHIPNMKEKTLRFPGHIEYIQVLKEAGFLSHDKIKVNGSEVSPFDFTCKILFDEWKLGDEEDEFTIMRVTVKGEGKTIVYNLYDEYDPTTKTSSMARTTGYTATAAVELIFGNLFNEKGVFPPELVGKHKACFDHFLTYLEERGIVYEKEEFESSVANPACP